MQNTANSNWLVVLIWGGEHEGAPFGRVFWDTHYYRQTQPENQDIVVVFNVVDKLKDWVLLTGLGFSGILWVS